MIDGDVFNTLGPLLIVLYVLSLQIMEFVTSDEDVDESSRSMLMCSTLYIKNTISSMRMAESCSQMAMSSFLYKKEHSLLNSMKTAES